MADKDHEISNYKSKIEWLEEKISKLHKQFDKMQEDHCKQVERIKREKETNNAREENSVINDVKKEDSLSSDSKSNESVVLSQVSS